MVIYLLCAFAVYCLVLLVQRKLTLGMFVFTEIALITLMLAIASIIPFGVFMLLMVVLTGGIWLIDSLFLKKNRPANSEDPEVLEYAKSFFPVILVVFFVRSFIVEPFKIPSGSMMPTLLTGDFILVNKFTYGLREPVFNHTFFEVGKPKRGDVFVFHFPPEPTTNYIKRVIGLPGDKISYQDKRLTINGKLLDVTEVGDYEYVASGLNMIAAKQYREQLSDDVQHEILIDPAVPVGLQLANGEEITIPAGQYLAMGDNRDNSSDSRAWGFVPEQNLVGKAFFIWMNIDQPKRIGTTVK
jgi:signal peptidase I